MDELLRRRRPTDGKRERTGERPISSVPAYRLRNQLQRETGQLRRLLDGADLSDPTIRRRVRLRLASMVDAVLGAESDFEEEESAR